MTPEQEQKLDEVYQFIKDMEASYSVPLKVEQALKGRLSKHFPIASASAKAGDSEDVTVNEGGAASYAVADDPDGFIQLEIGGFPRQIPYYNV